MIETRLINRPAFLRSCPPVPNYHPASPPHTMAPSPRMRLRSARLPDLDNPHPHPPNAEAGPSSPRKPKPGAGGELRRVPSKSKLSVVGSRPRKPSGRARREGTAGEESGNESEGSRRGVLRSAGGGGRSRGRGGGRVRFKKGWERMDVLCESLSESLHGRAYHA